MKHSLQQPAVEDEVPAEAVATRAHRMTGEGWNHPCRSAPDSRWRAARAPVNPPIEGLKPNDDLQQILPWLQSSNP